jgi:Ca-activated chloride channel family protein
MYPTPADNSREIARALASLRPGGSTNAEAGLRIGYRMAREQFTPGHTNRIILCSDGVANVGLTSPEALMEEIQQRAGDGITLSSFGVGMGNYNDVLLEKLAQQGNGRYAYMNDRREAYKVMVTDFLENVQLLARDVKIQVEFDPEVVRSYRLLGYENRDVRDNQFRDNRADGGEIGPGHEVTALYEIVWQHRPARVLGTVALRWKDENGEEVTELNRDLVYPRVKRGEHMSTDLRLAVTAAKFSEMLKGTVYVRDLRFDELYRFAESLREERPTEETFELLDLIRRADEFSTYHTRR